MILAYSAGKLCRRMGLPAKMGYVGIGALARGSGFLPAHLFLMSDPLAAMALAWVGFAIGCEIGRMGVRGHGRVLLPAFSGSLFPFCLAFLALRALIGMPTPVALTLAVSASLADPLLGFVSPDHLPETTRLTFLCAGISLVVFIPLISGTGNPLPFLSGLAGAALVALMWSETLVRVAPAFREEAGLAVFLLLMVILLQWTAPLLGHSILLTALLTGLSVGVRGPAAPGIARIEKAMGSWMGAVLMAVFGMQLPVERLPDLPSEVWGITAVYLGAMIGGKLLAGVFAKVSDHPYGRLAGIALLPQGLLLLEMDAQVGRRADWRGGSEGLIHSILMVAALIGSLLLPVLDYLLRRWVMATGRAATLPSGNSAVPPS
jgi:Kef-type K+ transport system membrane component KefB